ncbi:hypothetical protein ABZ614_06320 [Streptomyces sp. NPDC013178]|uniref:hypothetical protein n=1 Tax=unclassified Streptomyces TaxID=2593676 RepID=UPI003405EF9E
MAYVGDTYTLDAEGAQGVGVHAYWLDRANTSPSQAVENGVALASGIALFKIALFAIGRGRASSRSWRPAAVSVTPVGRVGEPRDVAEAYLYLMRGGYSTGSVVVTDGGGLLV